LFFLYFEKKVPVRRTGAYRHKKALLMSMSPRSLWWKTVPT